MRRSRIARGPLLEAERGGGILAPCGALTGSMIGELRCGPASRRMLRQAMAEIAAVAGGHGVELPADTLERTLVFIDALPPEGTASMHRELLAGRPSELDYQNGAVVRLGPEAGVPTPVNAEIYEALLPLERSSRRPLS